MNSQTEPTKRFASPLILGSQSPRRRELLERAGYQFEIRPPAESIEQGICSRCAPGQFVLQAAFLKGRAIAADVEQGTVIAADTIAECRAEILGKPINREHAEKMLRLLSGQRHRVLTAVSLWDCQSGRHLVRLEQTVLRMDQLTDEQLETILDSDLWIGKAGAFGYQDGLDWVHVETGLESNVVGLPVERLPQWFGELAALENA